MGAADAAGKHGAVLRVNVNGSAVDFAEAGDDSVGGQFLFRHAEVGALGFGEHELFDKTVRIEELLDALAGRKLAFGALPGGRLGIGFESGLFQRGKPRFEYFSGLGHGF